ncbi:MAG: CCA tRNA nucleotidyltransferase [Betaproteobacteria bacterium]
MNERMEVVTKRILPKITPSKEERLRVETLSHRLEEKITVVCKAEGIAATVRVEGSVAKDTWLSGNPDIDVFMRLPTSIPRKNLGDVGLRIAKKAVGDAEQIERYAEHPYLEINIEGTHADIVPCYDAKLGEWQSATDRTPYHTDYIKTHLKKTLLGEVRLLKQFMVGTGVYGAEIKVGGFSGYLCELLVMKFGSFAETVEAFARYSRRIVVDIEGFYRGREREIGLLFTEPLVIVDPVDKARNVASAVQAQKLYTFIAASREFLKKPSEAFFYPPKRHASAPNLIADRLTECAATYVFVVIGELTAVPDVLWGQLYRTKRSLRRLLETNEFKVLKDAVWSNETSLSIFTFELEQQVLPKIKKHLGPPLEREAESEKFLEKYASDKQVLAGPYVEDGRWIVEVPRKIQDAATLLSEKLANAGVAELVAKAAQQDFKVLVNGEVLKVYVENSDFAVFLTEFLTGKPFWLETH